MFKKKLAANRMSGGNSWASAMFRKNAASEPYASSIFKIVIDRNNLMYERFEMTVCLKTIRVSKGNRLIWKLRFSQLEHMRQTDAFLFEKSLEKCLLDETLH